MIDDDATGFATPSADTGPGGERPAKIHAPWTPEQAVALNRYQVAMNVHPYTCANGCGDLIATTGGWKCCRCRYVQTWALAASLTFGQPPTPPAGEPAPGGEAVQVLYVAQCEGPHHILRGLRLVATTPAGPFDSTAHWQADNGDGAGWRFWHQTAGKEEEIGRALAAAEQARDEAVALLAVFNRTDGQIAPVLNHETFEADWVRRVAADVRARLLAGVAR